MGAGADPPVAIESPRARKPGARGLAADAGQGFVGIEQNKGAVVKQADASTIQNIFKALQILEPWFAAHADQCLPDSLKAIQKQMPRNAGDDLPASRTLEAEFHGFIYSHHYNDVSADFWSRLRKALNVHSAPRRADSLATRGAAVKDPRRLTVAVPETPTDARALRAISRGCWHSRCADTPPCPARSRASATRRCSAADRRRPRGTASPCRI